MIPRQRRFVTEYLVDLNATGAARRAGYSARYGPGLLRDAAVADAVAKAQAERAERTGVSADRVVKELAKIAFGDPRRLFTWGPGGVELRDSAELSEAEATLVSEVSESRTARGGTRRVKLHCKLTALTALGKHLGLFGNGRRPGGPAPEHAAEMEAGLSDDARERLARRIDQLAERRRQAARDRLPERD